jgi:L-ascorbate metabolism protein UlaG (beta-lactamase superfamily)
MTALPAERALALDGRVADDAHDAGSIFFVGNATTLIRYGGFAVLTDPNFLHAGDHAHLCYGLRSRRLRDPAVDVEDLPPLDACVLSHLHGDHWDRVAERKLPRDLPIVTTPHAARRLGERGFVRTVGLPTWEHATLRRGDAWLRVTSLPARHGPPVVHRALPPTMGSMLEWGRADAEPVFRLWISGDTLVHDALAEIPRRYPDVPLALVHLGGTRVLGILLTMDAEQGVRALQIVRPRKAIPIHYDDYTVFRSPLADFLRAAEAAELATEVHVLRHGERFDFRVRAREAARAGAGPAEAEAAR